MKINDLMTIASVALTTATLTLINFWPATLDADDHDNTPSTAIAQPKLLAHGIGMTLATAHGRTFTAGDQPQLELTATNTTGEPATAEVNISLTASSPADRMSRVLRIPQTLWRQNLPVALQPDETRTFAITVPAKLPPASIFAVTIAAAGPHEATATALPAALPAGVVALRFATAAPVVQTRL